MSEANSGPSTHSTQWQKLFRNGHWVGYLKTIDQTKRFSTDGRRWSAESIEADVVVPQLPVRDLRGGRIFHGDVIRLSDGQSPDPYLTVCVLKDDKAWALSPSSEDRLLETSKHLGQVAGSIYSDISLSKVFDARYRAWEMNGEPVWLDASLITIAAVFFMAASLIAQWFIFGHLGLVLTSLCAFLGVGMVVFIQRRRHRDWLKRSRLLTLAPRVAALLGTTLASLYGSLAMLGVPGLGAPGETHVVPIVCAGIFGFILGLTSTIIGGDLIAHVTGGHSTGPYGGPKGMTY